ncbi:MAG: histidine kinase [Xanthomonadales bacterium]|nr:histidine kinase [Xanthomonadales bacterium]
MSLSVHGSEARNERLSGLPSFCRWRAVSGVAMVSLLACWLIVLGGAWPRPAPELLALMTYALGLGLVCAFIVCSFQGILSRLTLRLAWVWAWLLVLLTALAVSYVVGVISTVLGSGPGPEALSAFVLKSVLAAGLVSLALFRYLFVRSRWQAEMVAESEARVHALQARIRPHFLFNSLNTIASYIPEDPQLAERATEDLADLFRGSLRNADDPIPLADELALARKYLAMEQRRLGDRLAIDWDVEDLPGAEPVLPMLLQPLLENAVTHGIQPRAEGGLIQVFGRREGGRLVITIANPLAEQLSRSGNGMALQNIRSRLALSYSSLASLLTHRDDDCFYAVLTLPYADAADR